MLLRDRFIRTSLSWAGRRARLFACAALLGIGQAGFAQPDEGSEASAGERPASAGRVVRAFDFEEQDFNPLPVPLGWYRGQEDPDIPRVRPGFPIWNHGVLDYQSPAFSGIGSVKLPTQGGSTSLILRRGEINVFPNADYLISARVRTSGLSYARAGIVATLLDQYGDEIPDAQSMSRLIRTDGRWEQVSLEIEGVYPTAAFVQVELVLLQPKQQGQSKRTSGFEVWKQDYDGAAWFDNLIIAQLPRLEISTGVPGNIVESSAPPPLRVLVRDLTGDAIIARIRVFDVMGREVDSTVFDDGSRRVRTLWVPELPGFGWYRAVLEVVVDEQLVGLRTLDFIWASDDEPDADSGMFSIHARLTDPKIAESALQLIRGAGVTRASVEAWTRQTTREEASLDSVPMRALGELLAKGIELSVVLAELPRDLARQLAKDPNEVLSAFAGPPSAWIPWGGAMLDQYGQGVSRWRFGDRPTQEAPSTLNTMIDAAIDALTGYVPGPILVVPWSIERPIEPGVVGPNRQLLIVEKGNGTEEAMELLVDDWVQAARRFTPSKLAHPPELGMVLAPLHDSRDWSGVQIWSSMGTLARKAISFWWAARSSSIDAKRFHLELSDAWWISAGKRGQVMPAPELVVWRTLATHLGGREAIEELDLMAGVRMLVAGPKPGWAPDGDGDGDGVSGALIDEADRAEHTGVLILWLEEPRIDPVVLNLPLGRSAVMQYDVFNNGTRIELDRVGSLALPMHRVEIGRSPIILHGVNTELVRFLSALRLAPETLQAKSGIHHHALRLSNPWAMTIQGRVYIVEPGGYTGEQELIDRSWEITPRVVPFVLDAHETREIPIDIAYSLGELAGEKKLTFDVELDADQRYPLMRIERKITLELDGVLMDLSARRGDDGVTIVGVHVTNTLDTEQSFEIIAIPPNEPRLRRSINGVGPGKRVTREFAFTKAQPGDDILVSLIVGESSVRLNKAILVP